VGVTAFRGIPVVGRRERNQQALFGDDKQQAKAILRMLRAFAAGVRGLLCEDDLVSVYIKSHFDR
jgi:hypothetical protein